MTSTDNIISAAKSILAAFDEYAAAGQDSWESGGRAWKRAIEEAREDGIMEDAIEMAERAEEEASRAAQEAYDAAEANESRQDADEAAWDVWRGGIDRFLK